MSFAKRTGKAARSLGRTIKKHPGKTALAVGAAALAAAGTVAAVRAYRKRK